MARGLGAGDVIKVGKTVELEALDTPGHTMSHVCLLSHTDQPALFCGDTLFNAGAGNCHNGGHPEALYKTFSEQLAKLPDDTLHLSGPRLHREQPALHARAASRTTSARRRCSNKLQGQDPNRAYVTTLGDGAGDQHLLPPDEPHR